MNLIINSKFIQLLLWLFAPIIIARFIISSSLFFIDTKEIKIEKEQIEKESYIYKFPNFFDVNDNEEIKVEQSENIKKLDNLVMIATYLEKDREFVMLKEGKRNFFISLNDSYKGIKLVKVDINKATFLKNSEYLYLTISKDKKIKNSRVISGIKNIKDKHLDIKEDKYISIKRDEITKYTTNMKYALKDVRFEIKTKDDEEKTFNGIQFSFIRKNSLFDKMGLKKDDIIKSIDNKELKNIMDLMPYYKSLENISSMQIKFQRGEKIKEIIYEID